MSNLFKLQTSSENGIPYYVIPADNTLYRGGSSNCDPTFTLEYRGSAIFFGFDAAEIEKNYGITYEFTNKEELRCIAIDQLDTDSVLYIEAPDNIKDIFKKNYGIQSKIRTSDLETDKLLTEYICEKCQEYGYDGYASNKMNTAGEGEFHPEMAVCNLDKINPIGTRVTAESKCGSLIADYNDKRRQNEDRKKRNAAKKRYAQQNDENDDDHNYGSSKKKLFGGSKENKKTKKIKTKKIKNKKIKTKKIKTKKIKTKKN
jgi:hypothetical protein